MTPIRPFLLMIISLLSLLSYFIIITWHMSTILTPLFSSSLFVRLYMPKTRYALEEIQKSTGCTIQWRGTPQATEIIKETALLCADELVSGKIHADICSVRNSLFCSYRILLGLGLGSVGVCVRV